MALTVRQVHHFNPGGNVPAWLMNWLAEGKPMSFVRRLEDVAKEWDRRAAEYKSMHKSMPCKGRGFGESPTLPCHSLGEVQCTMIFFI